MKSIFLVSVIIAMYFGGILKLIFFNYTKRTIHKITFIKEPLDKIMSFGMPIFELTVPTLFLVFGENIYLYSLTTMYYFVFIAMNLTSMYDDVDCCCYGKLLKSKLGLGGVVHYLYFLCINVLAIYCYNFNGRIIYIKIQENICVRCGMALLVCICGLMYRRVLELVVNIRD
jgi:hypothetical protein